MKVSRTRALTGLLAAAGLALTACGSDDTTPAGSGATGGTGGTDTAKAACATGNLAATGATFQLNIQKQWIKDYAAQCSGATIDYTGTGSGAGVTQFSAGTVDFAGSDSLMKTEDQAKADARCGAGNRAIHLPITAGGVALLYNLQGVTDLKLTPETIGGIFGGSITQWSDPKIKADNPNATLPSIPIQAVHRSDSSGTTNVFTSYLDAAAKSVWTLGKGNEVQWPGGQAAKGSDGVTNAVKQAQGGITYAEQSFAESSGLPTAQVQAGDGFAEVDADSVSKSLAQATVDESKGDVRVSVDYAAPAEGAYPISTVSYVIVCDRGNKNAALLKGYLSYAAGDGQKSASSIGFAPLAGPVAEKVTSKISSLA